MFFPKHSQRQSGLWMPHMGFAGPWNFNPCTSCCSPHCGTAADCHDGDWPATIDLVIPDDFVNVDCDFCVDIGGTYTLTNNQQPVYFGYPDNYGQGSNSPADNIWWYVEEDVCTTSEGFFTWDLRLWVWHNCFSPVRPDRCRLMAGIELTDVGSEQNWYYRKTGMDLAVDLAVDSFTLDFFNYIKTAFDDPCEEVGALTVTVQPT